jgi:acetyl esterase/lipase
MGQLEDRALMSGGSWSFQVHFASAPAAALHRPGRPPGDPRWTKTANVPFPTVDGQFQVLDVYLPRAPLPAGGRPVLIAIHGGGWRRLDKSGYGERIAGAFVPRGYAVIAPNYRLSAPGEPSWPMNFEDIQAAARWVRANSGMLGIDPNEIAAVGESAGANLAALMGTASVPGGAAFATPPSAGNRAVSAAVEAVVAFSAPTDLAALQAISPLAGLAAAQFLGGSPQQVGASYIAASPLDHVSPGDPPMFLVHGRQDSLVPPSQSRAMATALSAAGVRNRLVLVSGGHDLDFPAHYANLIPKILEFLDATWKDGGSPTSLKQLQA